MDDIKCTVCGKPMIVEKNDDPDRGFEGGYKLIEIRVCTDFLCDEIEYVYQKED